MATTTPTVAGSSALTSALRHGWARAHAARAVWQALYDSPWHHPALAWIAVVLFGLMLALRQRFLVGYLMVFGLEIAADALASAPFIHLPSGVGAVVAIFFVVAGDFRVFLLVERCAAPRGLALAGGLRALGLAVLVPLASAGIRLAVPVVAATPRLQYLAYEGLFVVLALVLRFAILPRRLEGRDAETRQWALDVMLFALVQYVLWVAADVLLLAGLMPAHAVRIVPNLMYYALFLPFVYGRAPRGEREVVAARP